MNWHPGDTAIIANDMPARLTRYTQYRGMPCLLIRYIGLHYSGEVKVRDAWEIRTDSKTAWVNERYLRKPYDGNELCEWSDVIWQPKELVVTS